MNTENINKIFKAYDVRGVYKEEFDEETAEKTAKATVKFLGAKSMLVAIDARDSSESLKNAVIKGLLNSGVRITYIGVSTTPMFYFAVNKEKTDGGIMITASHNPPQYNGLKITRNKALPVGENSGLSDIKELVLSDDTLNLEKKGVLIMKNLTDEYVSFLARDSSDLNIKIAADFSCGASSDITKKLSEKLNIKLFSLCEIGSTPNHEGNPLKDENVSDLKNALKHGKYDLGVAFDTDADRVFFFTPEGKRIDSAVIASLLSENYLSKNKGLSFVGSVNISKIFEETVKENGGKYEKSKVGHVFLKEAMQKYDAVLGAELSGHFYFKEFFYADAAILTMLKVLNIIKKSGKSIAELTEKYNKYFNSGELNFKVVDKEKSLKDIAELFSEGAISHKDGVTIKFPDFWLNARPSNTEPLLRVNIEADSKELLSEVVKKIESTLK